MLNMIKKFMSFVEIFVALPILIALFLVLIIQVFSRYILRMPLYWSQDVVSILFVWMCFIGSSISCYRESMVRMDFLEKKFPKRLRAFIFVMIPALLGVLALLFISYSTKLFIREIPLELSTIPVSSGTVYLAGPVMFVFLVLICLNQIIERLIMLKEDKK